MCWVMHTAIGLNTFEETYRNIILNLFNTFSYMNLLNNFILEFYIYYFIIWYIC